MFYFHLNIVYFTVILLKISKRLQFLFYSFVDEYDPTIG